LRGGAFIDSGFNLRAPYRNGNIPEGEGCGFGFRVAYVSEPTSLAILALGGVGMLVRRRGLGR